MGRLKNKINKPTGFSRPTINLSGVEREWKTVLVSTLVENDIVANMGKIISVNPTCGSDYHIEAGFGDEYYLDKNTEVFAFVRKDSN